MSRNRGAGVTSTEPTYIVAYNFRTYCSWCREQDISPRLGSTTVYVTLRKLQGIRSEPKVKFIGEWADRDDTDAILSRLAELGAVNVDTGDTVEQMVSAIVERIRRMGQPTAAQLASILQGIAQTAQGDYAGEPAGERARRLVDTFRNAVPVTLPRLPPSEPPGRALPPPTRDGESLVYLLDGPRAGSVIPMWDTHDIWMIPASYDVSLQPTPPVVYSITTANSCTLIQLLGTHDFTPGVCDTSVRVGFSGLTEDYPDALHRSARAILDSGVPEWGRAARWASAAGTWNGGNYQTYTTYPENTPRRYWWQRGLDTTAPPTPTPTPSQNDLRPVQANERDWPSPDYSSDYGTTCAHICGGDHECEARAVAQFRYRIPTGGWRGMPVCATCYDAETAAVAAAEIDK